ncbi:hypothetical protein IGI67_001811 [Enterococcus sp. AZ196]
MKYSQPVEYLDDKQWSPLWEKYLAKADVFDPLNVNTIDCVMTIPEREGVLVFSEKDIYYSPNSAHTTLEHFSTAYFFADYTAMSTCLKSFGCFGQYKSPWICPFFALCPLEGGHQTIWINPLKIHKVQELQGETYAFMDNGTVILLPLARRSVIARAEITCAAFATLRRDCFQFVQTGERPLDYLMLPNTPFSHSLSKRVRLTKFSIPFGHLIRRYRKTYWLHVYKKLDANDFTLLD